MELGDFALFRKIRNYRAQWCTPKNAILWTPQLTPHAHSVKAPGAELAFLLHGGAVKGRRKEPGNMSLNNILRCLDLLLPFGSKNSSGTLLTLDLSDDVQTSF